jgi:hypothetical protein
MHTYKQINVTFAEERWGGVRIAGRGVDRDRVRMGRRGGDHGGVRMAGRGGRPKDGGRGRGGAARRRPGGVRAVSGGVGCDG